MRILLFANGSGGVGAVRGLVEQGHDLLVIAPPGGRFREWHMSISEACETFGIECLDPIDPNSALLLEKYCHHEPDLTLSVLYHKILSNDVLNISPLSINFHPSLLPAYRGTAPLIWVIVEGETETGVTAHQMTDRVDQGEIYGRRRLSIDSDETGFELHQRAASEVISLVMEVVHRIQTGTLHSLPPIDIPESHYTSKTPYVNALDPPNQTCQKIHEIVRALSSPLPNAWYDHPLGRWLINKVEKCDADTEVSIRSLAGENNHFTQDGNNYLVAMDGVLRIIV